jgi:hypothetical protein
MEVKFFDFEAAFVNSLRSVPMIVRYKLDACGIKLTLRAWSQFSLSTRARLVTMKVETLDEVQAYRNFLSQSILDVGDFVVPTNGDVVPAWANPERLPEAVARKAQELNVRMDGGRHWSALQPLQRFALLKLTRGGHENENFVPALREFGLVA